MRQAKIGSRIFLTISTTWRNAFMCENYKNGLSLIIRRQNVVESAARQRHVSCERPKIEYLKTQLTLTTWLAAPPSSNSLVKKTIWTVNREKCSQKGHPRRSRCTVAMELSYQSTVCFPLALPRIHPTRIARNKKYRPCCLNTRLQALRRSTNWRETCAVRQTRLALWPPKLRRVIRAAPNTS